MSRFKAQQEGAHVWNSPTTPRGDRDHNGIILEAKTSKDMKNMILFRDNTTGGAENVAERLDFVEIFLHREVVPLEGLEL